jgi:hypothetical protein
MIIHIYHDSATYYIYYRTAPIDVVGLDHVFISYWHFDYFQLRGSLPIFSPLRFTQKERRHQTPPQDMPCSKRQKQTDGFHKSLSFGVSKSCSSNFSNILTSIHITFIFLEMC